MISMMYSLSFISDGFCVDTKWSADKAFLLTLASHPHHGCDVYLNPYDHARFISSEKI